MAKNETDVQATLVWTDLTVAYPELANVPATVQNKSSDLVVVNFSASAAPPGDSSGYRLMALESRTGTAAHIWAMSLSGNATIACGLADVSGSSGGTAGAAQDGTDGTGIAPPTGGAGIRGWLSGIFKAVSSATPAGTNTIGTVLGPLPASLVTGQQTVTTSAVPLPANALQNGIVITARPENTGFVYVGAAGVTTATGYRLSPGQSWSGAIANTSGVSVIGTSAGDHIDFTGN